MAAPVMVSLGRPMAAARPAAGGLRIRALGPLPASRPAATLRRSGLVLPQVTLKSTLACARPPSDRAGETRRPLFFPSLRRALTPHPNASQTQLGGCGLLALPQRPPAGRSGARIVAEAAAATPAPAEPKKFLGISAFTWTKVIPLGERYLPAITPTLLPPRGRDAAGAVRVSEAPPISSCPPPPRRQASCSSASSSTTRSCATQR